MPDRRVEEGSIQRKGGREREGEQRGLERKTQAARTICMFTQTPSMGVPVCSLSLILPHTPSCCLSHTPTQTHTFLTLQQLLAQREDTRQPAVTINATATTGRQKRPKASLEHGKGSKQSTSMSLAPAPGKLHPCLLVRYIYFSYFEHNP